jgi:CrcB protein
MTWLAVVVGGLVGTGLRLGLDVLLPHADDTFPWSTLVANIVGSFTLGVLVTRVWPSAPTWLRAGLGAGVLGSFTTFSAVIASYFLMTNVTGPPLLGLLYVAISLVAGPAAAYAGLRAGGLRRTPAIGPEE